MDIEPMGNHLRRDFLLQKIHLDKIDVMKQKPLVPYRKYVFYF